MVMLRTGERSRKTPAVLALTWGIHHIQPETAAELCFSQCHKFFEGGNLHAY
jgi:hypothetical protein